MTAIRDNLSDLASQIDDEDGEDEADDEDDTAHGKVGEHNEPGWVLGTISNTEIHRMERFRQKQIRLGKRMQPGEGDSADCISESEMKYGMTELKVSAVGKLQTDTTAATPSPTTFGAHMQAPHIVPGQFQMPQVTSHQGSSEMRKRLTKSKANNYIEPQVRTVVPDRLG